MKTLITATLLVIALAGCKADVKTPATFVVGQHEDCTLFRTVTSSRPDITWVRCKAMPKVTQSVHKESCGKGCTREVLVSTTEETK